MSGPARLTRREPPAAGPLGRRAAWLVAGCAAVACGGSEEPLIVETVDSSRVTIVTTVGPDRDLGWQREVRFRVSETSGPNDVRRVDWGSVSTNDRGSILVLDTANHRALMYDSTGEYTGNFGGRGSGRMQTETPVSLTWLPNGGFAVHDVVKPRLEVFSLEDTSGTWAVETAGLAFGLRGVATGMVAHHGELEAGGGYRHAIRFHGRGGTRELAGAPRPAARPYRSGTCDTEGVLMGVPFFAPTPRWDARGSRAVYAMGSDYAVTVEDMVTGRRRSLRRPVERDSATAALAEAEAEASPQWVRTAQGMCAVPAAEAVAGRGYEPVIPVVDSVAVAWDGHVWVKRWRPAGADRVIDVFDPEGAYAGTLTGWPFPVGFLPGGDVLVVETEEDGVQWIAVLRIVDSGAG